MIKNIYLFFLAYILGLNSSIVHGKNHFIAGDKDRTFVQAPSSLSASDSCLSKASKAYVKRKIFSRKRTYEFEVPQKGRLNLDEYTDWIFSGSNSCYAQKIKKALEIEKELLK